jgi:hypothetical protein
MRAKTDVFSTRLNVASNRQSDGTRKCRLGRERSRKAQRAGAIENYQKTSALVRSAGKACGASETIMSKHSALGASILLLVGLAGCAAEQKELGRQIAPGQKLVAVLMESTRSDAMHQDIYVNDQGIALNLDKPVFSAVGCDHLRFAWSNDYTLEIHYETTCVINQFTNRWDRPSNIAAGRLNPIEIVLIRG